MRITIKTAGAVALPLAFCVAVAGMALPVQPAQAEASAATLAALSDAQARYEAACAELDYMYQLVYEAQNEYDQTTYQLQLTNAAIATLQAQIEQEKIELAEAQEILSARLDADYRAGDVEMWDVILSATSFEDLVSRIYYAGKVSDADAAAIQAVKDIKAQLEADEAALQEQRVQQEALLAQQAAQLEELNYQLDQTAAYVASLDYEVRALFAQAQAEAQAAAEAAWAAQQAQQAQQAQDVIDAAADAGYTYDEDAGSWTDSSGNYVDSDTVAADTGLSSSVVDRAMSWINTPYNLGSNGSDGYIDCSGLTSQAYGGEIPHWSYAQYQNSLANGTFTTDLSSLSPGDCVYYSYDGGATTYHVALYIGNGQVIDAIPNGGVQIRDINFCSGAFGGGNPCY